MEKKKVPGEQVALWGLGVLAVAALSIACYPELEWWVIPCVVVVGWISFKGFFFLLDVVSHFIYDVLGWNAFGFWLKVFLVSGVTCWLIGLK